MPPKGKRRSNALVTRDAFELLRRVDGENEDIDEARVRPPLKLSRSRAYDLLGRARSAVLRPQNEANKKAAEVNVKRWFEPMMAATEVNNGIDTTPMPDGTRAGTEVMQHDSGEVEPQLYGSVAPPEDATQVDPNLTTATAMELPDDAVRVDPEFITLPDGTKRRIKPQEPTEDIYEWSHVMDYSAFRTKTPWRQQQLIAQWKENEALGGKHVNLRGKPKTGPCFGSCPTGNCTCNEREDF